MIRRQLKTYKKWKWNVSIYSFLLLMFKWLKLDVLRWSCCGSGTSHKLLAPLSLEGCGLLCIVVLYSHSLVRHFASPRDVNPLNLRNQNRTKYSTTIPVDEPLLSHRTVSKLRILHSVCGLRMKCSARALPLASTRQPHEEYHSLLVCFIKWDSPDSFLPSHWDSHFNKEVFKWVNQTYSICK